MVLFLFRLLVLLIFRLLHFVFATFIHVGALKILVLVKYYLSIMLDLIFLERLLEHVRRYCDVILTLVDDHAKTLWSSSRHESFPKVGLASHGLLEWFLWIYSEFSIVALASAFDMDGHLHVDSVGHSLSLPILD